jgi:hypothetical protein
MIQWTMRQWFNGQLDNGSMNNEFMVQIVEFLNFLMFNVGNGELSILKFFKCQLTKDVQLKFQKF